MQKFSYRSPRYAVDLPVVLESSDGRFEGRCREISKEGMRVELGEALPSDFSGTAALNYQRIAVRVRVSVLPGGLAEHRVKFTFESESERTAIARLVAVLAGRTGQQNGPILVR